MSGFSYRASHLHAEEAPLGEIAERVGTPCYVYSQTAIEERFRAFDAAFAGRPHLVCYSVKASSTLAILRALARAGAGADIVSVGELRRALRAGVPPQKIVFAGVGKREDEIEEALRAGILALNVESHEELLIADRAARRLGARAPVALRVNPDVDAETHPYISTGLRKNKFGIPIARAREEYVFARALPGIELRGVACHIGSQLLKTAPLKDAVARVARLVRELRDRDGIALTHLDVGGGVGIRYKAEDEEPPAPAAYRAALDEATAGLRDLDLTIVCEPGRAIVGDAGVLLTRVLYDKQGETKRFVVVDAAFNDLVRPALYGAHHEIRPVERREGAPDAVVDVVGPICESGDFLARDRSMPLPMPGDLLAVMSAGAYGFSMASTYNSRPRPAEVLVRGGRWAVIRQRETLDDLMRGEELVELG